MNEANVGHSLDRQSLSVRLKPWLVWGLAALYFFSDYFARVSPGVMSRYLQQAFSTSAAGLGALSASFYYPYVLMQIPVGIIVDRFSVRWILVVMSLLTAVGCSVFGLAGSLMVASLGRALIGFSAAFAFVSALRLAATWFPPQKLGLLAGMTQALGMLGAAVGEAPVSSLVASIGWRHTMLVMAFEFIVLAGFIYQFVQDAPKGGKFGVKTPAVETLSIYESLKVILLNRQTWFNAMYAGFLFAPTAVIGEFWGPSFLQYGHGLSEHAAAFATGLIFIGWAIGGPIAGWLSDKMCQRKPVMYFSSVAGMVIMSVIIFYPNLSETAIYLLFFLFGLTNAGVGIAYAVSTEIHSKQVVGTSIAFTNMSSIFIGAMLQPMAGALLDFHAGSAADDITKLGLTDFQAALWILPFCGVVSLMLAFGVKETRCKPVSG